MDNETFVPINFAPGYFVSNTGRIKKASGKEMSTPANAKGYLVFRCTLDGMRVDRLLHRVVAEHFIGPIDGMEINHKDFDKKNNDIKNLEIVTRAENMAHYKGSDVAIATGRKVSAAKTKYTPEEKKEKRREHAKRKLKGTGRGGYRPTNPGGRPPKADKRITVQVCLSPANANYLAAMGRDKNDWINGIIDYERNTHKNEWGVPTEY
jgi:hypothetical protein